MDSNSGPNFGDLLRKHRLASGLTQEMLAERAGLSAHGIQKLERGVTRPYRDTAQRLVSSRRRTKPASSRQSGRLDGAGRSTMRSSMAQLRTICPYRSAV